MDIEWDDTKHEVQLSMISYSRYSFKRFDHTCPRRLQDQTYRHVNPTYVTKAQYETEKYDTPVLSSAEKKFVQEVTVTFLYYARAIDTKMLPALGSISTQQAAPTEKTMQKLKQFLDYAATHPDAIITYRDYGMVLAAHNDASCLSETKARSRAGGHFFSCLTTQPSRQTMALSSLSPQSSRLSGPPPQRQS